MIRPLSLVTLAAAVCLMTSAAAHAAPAPVTLLWDANTEPIVVGYRVYVGVTPSVYVQSFDVGNVTSFTFRNGVVGQRYYFVVTAFAAGAIESPRSAEVSTVVTDGPPSGAGGVGEQAITLQPAALDGNTVTL